MKLKIKGYLVFLIPMISISLSIYILHYLIFKNEIATISGIILSLAYVPIGVIYEVLVIDKIIEKKQKISQEKKYNIVKGSFFHEIGDDILSILVLVDNNVNEIVLSIKEEIEADDDNLGALKEKIYNYECNLDMSKIEKVSLAKLLEEKDMILLNFILNPFSKDYDNFNNMIIELLHLRDELNPSGKCSGEYCSKKLSIDYNINESICYIYKLLLIEWYLYMKQLKIIYPELFIRELKNSPFACFAV